MDPFHNLTHTILRFKHTNDYQYNWESKTDIGSFVALPNDTFKVFKPKTLSATGYFRRIIHVGQSCFDTSNVVKITAQPYIQGNLIAKNDSIICFNQSPGLFKGNQLLTGGNGIYKYRWFKLINSSVWQSVSASDSFPDYISPNLNNNISLRRMVTSGVCSDSGKIINTLVLPLINNKIITANQHVCLGASQLKIEANLPEGGDNNYSFSWESSVDSSGWSVAAGVASDTNYISSEINRKSYFRRIVKSGLNNCCQSVSLPVSMSIDSLPSASFANFSFNTCANMPYSLPIHLKGKSAFHIFYTNGFKEFDEKNITSSIFTLPVLPDKEDTFKYKLIKVIDGNNCEAKDIRGAGVIRSYTKPIPFAGNDTTLCGLIAPLHAKVTHGKGIWKSIDSAVFSDSATMPNAVVTVSTYGAKQFVWLENNGGCKDSSSVYVTFEEQPLYAFADSNQTKPFLFKTTINASMPTVGAGTWSSLNKSIFIENPNSPTTLVDSLRFGKNILIWTVSNGSCKSIRDSVVLTVNDLFIPNGFSPNNDDKNQYFYINGLENVSNTDLIILNKWGKQVFHDSNYKNNWEGMVGNVELPNDTYFYILKTIGRTYKGFVVIKR